MCDTTPNGHLEEARKARRRKLSFQLFEDLFMEAYEVAFLRHGTMCNAKTSSDFQGPLQERIE